MSPSPRITAVLAFGFLLAACGKSEAPVEAPVVEAAPVSGVEEPRPAESFTTEAPEGADVDAATATALAAPAAPLPTVVQSPNIPGHEDRRLRKAVAEVPAALLGGQATDISADEAYDRAFKALYHYLGQRRIATQSFYLKYNDKQGGFWTYMFFGDPTPGEGLYVHVRVFPDGRAEIVD
jgi:hypothetical protein